MYVLYNIKIWKVVNMHTVTYTTCMHFQVHTHIQTHIPSTGFVKKKIIK